ncbi:MAG: NADH:flavin oxidoreductase [Dehalococcoidia bacterium]|nr:NADH:flavin oxidoreductase [Dehalococcoidia bacterium]
MKELYESSELNGMVLRNRFVHSATNEGMANNDDGTATERLIRLQEELAEGEVGLIIPGNAYVSEQGKSRPGQTGVHNDDTVEGLTKMAEAVHRHGSAIALQLTHAGGNVHVPMGTGYALGPSEMKLTDVPCRQMTKDDIAQTVADFAAAAVRAKQVGMDAVQLHGAHSYLLSEFVSPYFNKRTDEYGGSLENRARMAIETIHAVRDAVGPDYPVLMKINSDDYLVGGFPLVEMLPYALMLEKAGVDSIEISGGTHFSDPRFFCSRPVGTVPKEEELYFRQAAQIYRTAVKVPLMLVGGVRSFDVAESVVTSGLADYVSLCRPLIREPYLVKRWREGDRSPATCISCNLCFGPVRAGEGVYCVALERQSQKSGS